MPELVEELKAYKIIECLLKRKIKPGTLKDIQRQLERCDVPPGHDTYSFLIKLVKMSVLSLFSGNSDDGEIVNGQKCIDRKMYSTYFVDKDELKRLWTQSTPHKISMFIYASKQMKKIEERNSFDDMVDEWKEMLGFD